MAMMHRTYLLLHKNYSRPRMLMTYIAATTLEQIKRDFILIIQRILQHRKLAIRNSLQFVLELEACFVLAVDKPTGKHHK